MKERIFERIEKILKCSTPKSISPLLIFGNKKGNYDEINKSAIKKKFDISEEFKKDLTFILALDVILMI
jgi:hypothetical protein